MSLIRARYRAVNTIMNLPRGGFVGLLDLFPNAAAAYSLRKLRAAYSGSAVRVRRSSDNTEQDIGFTTQGELDTASLLSFVNEDVDVYTSDFTQDLNQISEFNGSGSFNETALGVTGAYKFTLTGGSVTHFATLNLPEYNQTYSITLDYYIPSGQTIIDLEATLGTTSQYTLNSVGVWKTETFTFVTSDDSNPNNRRLRFVTNSYTNISADGDVFYLKNIVVTQTTADGLVSTWYDQSLSNDATQGTAASQPKIVSGGSLVTENGKVAIEFDGVDDLLDMGQTIDLYSLASEWSVFMDAKIIDYSLQSFQRIIINDSSNNSPDIPFGIQLTSNNNVAFFNNGTAETTLTLSSATQRSLFSFIKRSGDVLIGINGSSTTSTKGSVDFTAGLENTTIGCSPNGSNRPANMKSAELIIYSSDQSANRTGIETNTNTFYSIYPDFSVSGLLHDYPNAAAAYSVRQLTIYNNGYKEKLIRIRRSSGGETDVFADDSYELSLNSRVSAGGTLGNWMGSDDGFVVTWYDQSTNGNDATQGTAANQPLIVSSGSMVVENGKPAVDFDGSGLYLATSAIPEVTQPATHIAILKYTAGEANEIPFSSLSNVDGRNMTRKINSNYAMFAGSLFESATAVTNDQQINFSLFNGASSSMWKDGTLIIDNENVGTQTIEGITIGSDHDANPDFFGKIQEYMVYASDQSANRAAIESNQATFYGITI